MKRKVLFGLILGSCGLLASSCGSTPDLQPTPTQSPMVATATQELALPSETATPVVVPSEATATPVPPESIATPTPVSQDQAGTAFDLVPFHYTVDEGASTWLVGVVDLAQVNITEHVAPGIRLDNLDVTVETLEGKTYPGTIDEVSQEKVNLESYDSYSLGVRGGGRDYYYPGDKELKCEGCILDLGHELLPPKLPVSVLFEVKDPIEYHATVLTFRFAKAAHPTKAVVQSPTRRIVIDLLAPSIKDATPYRVTDLPVGSLADLQKKLAASSGKLQLEIGSCEQASLYPWHYSLKFKATNTDQLDSEEMTLPKLGVWYPSGVYMVTPESVIKAGPSEEINNSIDLGGRWGGKPTYLVLYENDGSTLLYGLNCTSSP